MASILVAASLRILSTKWVYRSTIDANARASRPHSGSKFLEQIQRLV